MSACSPPTTRMQASAPASGSPSPPSVLQDVVDKLQKFGAIDRGWLGVQVRKTSGRGGDRRFDREGQRAVGGEDGRWRPRRERGVAAGDVIACSTGKAVRDIVAFRLGDRQSAAELAGDAGHRAQKRPQRPELSSATSPIRKPRRYATPGPTPGTPRTRVRLPALRAERGDDGRCCLRGVAAGTSCSANGFARTARVLGSRAATAAATNPFRFLNPSDTIGP